MSRFELEAREKPGINANWALLPCATAAMMPEAVAVVISRDDAFFEEEREPMSYPDVLMLRPRNI